MINAQVLRSLRQLVFGSDLSQLVKNLSAMQKIPVQFQGQEDPLAKG